jgi:glycosyltransferase involved in cell wall biosynthesis
MKILHVTFSFPPDPPGGTEVYVAGLAEDLAGLGIESVIAAPAASDRRYAHGAIEVRRFASAPDALTLEELYGEGDPVAAESFQRLMDAERPDVVHVHALTSACSIRLVRDIKRRGVPIVFTYHTPTASCQRGTMMLFGESACDGRLDVARCTACAAAAHGAPRGVAGLLGWLPPAIGDGLGRLGLAGGALTAARLSSLVRGAQQNLREFLATVDRIVALAPWVTAVLEVNDIARDKIVASPHGVAASTATASARRHRAEGTALRVAHLGRLHPAKGTELLIHAVSAMSPAAVALDIFGVVQDEGAAAESKRLQVLVERESHIRLLPSLPPPEVVETLADYDVLAVPSQWMETGPLVVLEAFAAGIPVIGSRLGGIADKVSHGVDGLLVDDYRDEGAWQAALGRCASDRNLVQTLRAGVTPPRQRLDVARDMLELYRAISVSADVAAFDGQRRKGTARQEVRDPSGVVRG